MGEIALVEVIVAKCFKSETVKKNKKLQSTVFLPTVSHKIPRVIKK